MDKIFLIGGKAGHGKSTFADLLEEEIKQNTKLPVLRIAYGDCLKWVCQKYFDWSGNKDEAGRELLQRIGTDVVRAKDSDFWARFVAQFINAVGNLYSTIIIDDFRFPNEIEIYDAFPALRNKIITIKIERYENGAQYVNPNLTTLQKAHPSEIALDDFIFDYIIENHSICELEMSARELLDDLNIL